MPTGAPDWQKVVTIETSLTAGAPDWERVVVGPGGTPVGGGGAAISAELQFSTISPSFGSDASISVPYDISSSPAFGQFQLHVTIPQTAYGSGIVFEFLGMTTSEIPAASALNYLIEVIIEVVSVDGTEWILVEGTQTVDIATTGDLTYADLAETAHSGSSLSYNNTNGHFTSSTNTTYGVHVLWSGVQTP